MSMKWSSEADASIFPSWLNWGSSTGQSSPAEQTRQADRIIQRGGPTSHSKWNKTNFYPTSKVLVELLTSKSIEHTLTHLHPKGWPKHLHFLLQSTSHGVKLDTDTVGRMGVDGLHRLQLWVAENKTDINQTGGHDPGTKIETGDAEEENQRQQNKHQRL